MKRSYVLKYTILVSIGVLLFLTLFGGFVEGASRTTLELWNLGHIVLFALLIYFICIYWKYCKKFSIFSQLLIVFLITGVLSIVIEIFQYFIRNNQIDLTDIRRNFAGAVLAFLLSKEFRIKPINIILKIIVIFWIIIETIPTVQAFSDEMVSTADFPVLSDFETETELTRWAGDAQFFRSGQKTKHGSHSLNVIFGTAKYSGVELCYFPSDWRHYSSLNFSIYNPEKDTLIITCRIFDQHHLDHGNKYNDRFNRRLQIQPGWNDIVISLTEIKEAPEERFMDLSKIRSVKLFSKQLLKTRSIYLDYVYLDK